MKREKKINFFNLEKTTAVQGIIKKFEIENKEISYANEIINEINRFLKKVIHKDFAKVNNFFKNIIFPVLTQEQKQDCEKEISKK